MTLFLGQGFLGGFVQNGAPSDAQKGISLGVFGMKVLTAVAAGFSRGSPSGFPTGFPTGKVYFSERFALALSS